MARIYMAVNGDDVGSKIGDAIASNDHMALSKLSSSVKDSHSMIEQWVQEKGGETITSNGDEGLFIVPEECLEELENIRAQYQQMSGHTLTVGVGNSMADASKALIYGKLNEKNQVVHYEPAIDDMLSDDQVEEAEQVEQAAGGDPNAQEQPQMLDGQEPNPDVPEGQQKQVLNEEQMNIASTPAEQPLDSGDTQDFADPDDNIEAAGNEVGEADDQDQMIDQNNNGVNDADEYDKLDPQQTVEQVVSQEQGNEDGDQMQNDENFDENADGIEDEATMDMDGDGDIDATDDSAAGAEIDTDDDDLANMVEDDMSGDEEGMEDEAMGQEEAPADDHADIKGAIMETLQIFRAHKPDLDMLASANPELHSGLISMLQNMIEMGKRLQGQGEMSGDEGEDLYQFSEEFPDAGDSDGDGDVDGDDEHMDEEQDEDVAEEEVDEHNEEMHGEDSDEDSAISDDEDPDEDATPDDSDESDDDSDSDDSDDDSSNGDDNKKPSFPPKKKEDKGKLEKK